MKKTMFAVALVASLVLTSCSVGTDERTSIRWFNGTKRNFVVLYDQNEEILENQKKILENQGLILENQEAILNAISR